MEHFRDTGFSYVIVQAAKQWTGAACEALGGVRVQFAHLGQLRSRGLLSGVINNGKWAGSSIRAARSAPRPSAERSHRHTSVAAVVAA
jgi:hypothetical protein